MPKPSLGVKLPFELKNNDSPVSPSGAAGDTNNIIKTLMTTPQSTPNISYDPQQPQWSGDPTIIKDPNNNFASTISDPTQSSPGFDPNNAGFSGVPIANTPSINSQNTPGFSLNSTYSYSPPVNNILKTLMAGSGDSSSLAPVRPG